MTEVRAEAFKYLFVAGKGRSLVCVKIDETEREDARVGAKGLCLWRKSFVRDERALSVVEPDIHEVLTLLFSDRGVKGSCRMKRLH